jgi:hypothetical protein
MSQEELKARTTQVMKEKGANYHFQAQFYEATSQQVVGSRDPKFCSLQSNPKQKPDEQAWAEAYEFIYDYLESLKMGLTLRTLGVEFRDSPKPRRAGTFDGQERDEYFERLCQVKRAPLQAEVRAFATQTR